MKIQYNISCWIGWNFNTSRINLVNATAWKYKMFVDGSKFK